MSRFSFNPNLAYALFGAFLVAGIVVFGLFIALAPQPDGSALAAVKTTQSKNPSTVAVPPGTGADAGRALFQAKACISCHIAPGIPGGGNIGPNLTGEAAKPMIAGVVPSTPENMQKWLLNPSSVKPGTAMPNLGLTADEALALTNFLATFQ